MLPRSVPDEEAKMPAEEGPAGTWLKDPGSTPVGVGGVEPHPPIGKELWSRYETGGTARCDTGGWAGGAGGWGGPKEVEGLVWVRI